MTDRAAGTTNERDRRAIHPHPTRRVTDRMLTAGKGIYGGILDRYVIHYNTGPQPPRHHMALRAPGDNLNVIRCQPARPDPTTAGHRRLINEYHRPHNPGQTRRPNLDQYRHHPRVPTCCLNWTDAIFRQRRVACSITARMY